MGYGCSKFETKRSSSQELKGNGIAHAPVGNASLHTKTKQSVGGGVNLVPKVAAVATKTLNIIHFNDVYNIESREQEPCGGVAKFVTKVREIQKTTNALVLFSGDAFNPSIMSTITKGEQMPVCLNNVGVHCAAVGNHDLDFGPERMKHLISECKFPWLMANVLDIHTNEPFEGCRRYTVLDWDGIKVGIIGLVEFEWLATLATLDVDDIVYIDFVEEGRRLVQLLKGEGCEVIIALTHMRVPNDLLLGQEVPDIDIILGGHDHHYEVSPCPPHETLMFKSGTDFRELSLIQMQVTSNGKPKVTYERVKITSDIPDDPDTALIVKHYLTLVGDKMENVVGSTAVPLDGRFHIIRTQESNMGNLIGDVLRFQTGADVALVNSGTLRSDAIHDAGPLKVRDLVSILPMMDDTCVISITGKLLLRALENGVSMYPKLEGRFLQVSGLTFEFDPAKPPGSRIDPSWVRVGGSPLDLDKEYSLATKEFLVHGKDGFDMFPECPIIRSAEDSPLLPTMIANHFDAIHRLNTADTNSQERPSSTTNKLLALAVEAGTNDGSAIVRWNNEQEEYMVDPCTENRIICRK